MDKDELRKHKEEIIGLLKSTGLEEMDDFIAELENTGYFTAPASMNGHMCYEGGLMIHSLNVYYAARELKATFSKMRPDVFERISDASIIIATLLHDMCKSNLYYKKRNAAYELGQSQYGSDQGSLPVGHGEKSVIMLLRLGLQLTNDEVLAIRWHMGAWNLPFQSYEDKCNISEASDHPLTAIIQAADGLATHIMEK